MADSLQDQLLALGLAKEGKKGGQKKPRRRSGPPSRQGRKTKVASSDGGMSLGKAWAAREREEQSAADRARARKQEEDRKRREINKAIREIVKGGRLNREDAEVPRNFMFRGRIRKIYVTPEQNRALGEGTLGLVYLSGGYHVLDKEHVDAVRNIAADHLVDLGGDGGDEKEFPVPDDLVW